MSGHLLEVVRYRVIEAISQSTRNIERPWRHLWVTSRNDNEHISVLSVPPARQVKGGNITPTLTGCPINANAHTGKPEVDELPFSLQSALVQCVSSVSYVRPYSPT